MILSVLFFLLIIKGVIQMTDNRVVSILMERDGMTEQEATDLIDECREQMLETGSDEPMMELLGLEPDYIMDIL